MITAVCDNCGQRRHNRAICQTQLQGQSTQISNQRHEQLPRRGQVQTVEVDREFERTYWLKQNRSEPGRSLEVEVMLELGEALGDGTRHRGRSIIGLREDISNDTA